MTKHLPRHSLLVLLVFICFSISAEESKIFDQAVLSDLLAAKSEDERSQILESNKNAVTVELRKALIEKGHSSGRKATYPTHSQLLNSPNKSLKKLGTARELVMPYEASVLFTIYKATVYWRWIFFKKVWLLLKK